MALPGSLNRYLLLMAQEHLEFRLPVSCPGVPGAEARPPHAPAWESAGSCARLDLGEDEAAGRTESPSSLWPGPSLAIQPSARAPSAAVKQVNLTRRRTETSMGALGGV